MSASLNGFQIYNALGFRGRSIKKVVQVLMKNGLRISTADVRKCLSIASRVGLMKKSRMGYRLAYRVCDNMVRTTLTNFLKQPKCIAESSVGTERWKVCAEGSVCSIHGAYGDSRLERAPSLLSILGERLGRSWSLLKINLKRPHSHDDATAEPEPKKLRSDDDVEIPVSQVSDNCWQGMNDFFKRFG